MIVISFQKELNRVDDRTRTRLRPQICNARAARGEQTEKYMTLHSGQTCKQCFTKLFSKHFTFRQPSAPSLSKISIKLGYMYASSPSIVQHSKTLSILASMSAWHFILALWYWAVTIVMFKICSHEHYEHYQPYLIFIWQEHGDTHNKTDIKSEH